MTKMILPPAAAAPRRGAITEEERRRNRKTSNRLSARRSRMKRQQHEDDLTAIASQLMLDNEASRATAGTALQRYRLVEQENRVLMANARELCSTLQLRNSQLRMLGEVACVPLDVPEVPGHLMQLYGGLQMPLLPPPPQIQMLFPTDDVMDDAASISMPWL